MPKKTVRTPKPAKERRNEVTVPMIPAKNSRKPNKTTRTPKPRGGLR